MKAEKCRKVIYDKVELSVMLKLFKSNMAVPYEIVAKVTTPTPSMFNTMPTLA